MNKSCQKKLEKILEGSKLNLNQMYLCKNPFTNVSLALTGEHASVYNYIIESYRKYYFEQQLGKNASSNKLTKHMRDYDKAREVFLFLNPTAYRLLVD
jgi:hypothetical protein